MDVKKTVAFLAPYVNKQHPRIAVVLGTGLARFGDSISIKDRIPYQSIPGFVASTVPSHSGEFIFGTIYSIPIIALSGRFHYYEGYNMQQVTFPIRVLGELGVSTLLLSNAAGSVNPSYSAGDIISIRDHINLFPENPLRGTNNSKWGVRFPDMMFTYSQRLYSIVKSIAQKNNLNVQQGVYVGTQGPNLETPAEYAFFNTIGGDLVGMSTIPEVIVAKHMNMEVLALSVVSNVCFPIDKLTETTMEEVIQVVQSAEPKLSIIFVELIQEIGHDR